MRTNYSYQMPRGVAGSLYDLAPYAIVSRLNDETETGRMKYGMGAMQGTSPGATVAIPGQTSQAREFEGIVMTGFTTEMDMDGDVAIRHQQTVGMLRYGNAWARIPEGLEPLYGQNVFLITNGANAGLFTNVATGNMAINARFIGGRGTGNVAPVELFNQKNE